MRILASLWVKAGLACLAVAAALLLLTSTSNVGQWHAELSYAAYTCGKGDICFLPNQRQRDANGREYRCSLNRLGFRGADLGLQRDRSDTVRVQVYGDSMVFGIGVDDVEDFPSALQRALSQRHPERRFEVQNFGLPMNYLPSNVRAYFAYGRDFDPDVVVFAYQRTGYRDMNYRILEIQRSP